MSSKVNNAHPGFSLRDLAERLNLAGNETRLKMLLLLYRAEMSVSQLAAATGMSFSATSQHLGKLRGAGAVTYRRDAQTMWYRGGSDPATNAFLALLSDDAKTAILARRK